MECDFPCANRPEPRRHTFADPQPRAMTAPGTGEDMTTLMDIKRLAAHLNVTESFIRRLIHERRIPFHKIGKFIRFHPADVDAWIQKQRVDQLGPG
jgi:excisionase family DNA binding protein